MSILVIYIKKTPKCYQNEQNCSEKISNHFKFTVLGKLVLLCYVVKKKRILISLHIRWLGLAVMGKYHSKLLMLFNVAFLMKCKHIIILPFANRLS